MATIEGWFFPKVRFDHAGEQSGSFDNEAALPAPIPAVNGDGMFQVFVLGTRGAGKTVFLASLFKSMQVQDSNENNFVLTCPDTKTFNNLNSIYTQISNPIADWPAGTMAKQEYVFDCEHMSDGSRIRLFKFRYFDFPGGFVDEFKNEDDTNFVFEQARSAHSVLVLLDGKKVLDLFDGRTPPLGQRTFYDDLDSLVGILQSCLGKPFHFAVTKSDILDSNVHSLSAIRAAMLRHPQLRLIIGMQSKKHPVHLMLVSAVGNDFARWDQDTQTMVKRPDGFIRPRFLDLSLTLTITDYIAMLSRKIAEDCPADMETVVASNWIWTRIIQNLPTLTAASAGLIGAGSIIVPPITALHPLFQLLAAGAISFAAQKGMRAGGAHIADIFNEFRKDEREALARISDKRTALDAILRNQIDRAVKFRESFPDSFFPAELGFRP